MDNPSLEMLIDKIESQTDYKFTYGRDIDLHEKLSDQFSFTDTDLEEVVNEISSRTPFSLRIVGDNISIVMDSGPRKLEKTEKFIPQLVINGNVTDASGVPLAGANILEIGTSNGTQTDFDGNFTVMLTSENATLSISYIGFVTKEIQVGGQMQISIILTEDAALLDEVVVVGYGSQRKQDVTGSVTHIRAADLENENPNNVEDILRGNVAGLTVGFSATAKGGGALEVRGRKSLNAGRSPLLVLDGIIYNGELSDINPVDIEAIDILKDASSTAVFGAKAANGVIVITTKKGKSGKPVINLNSSFGVSTMSVDQPINSPDGYTSWRSDVFRSQNPSAPEYMYNDPRSLPSSTPVTDWLAYDSSGGNPVTVWLQRLNFKQVEIDNYLAGKSVDWYDMMFQNGYQQDHNISLSNRKEDVSYYWSLGYQKNEGIIKGDEYSTIRSRLNLEGDVTDFITVGLNTQFSYRDESQVPVDWPQMTMISPWGSIYDDDGTLRFSPQDDPVAIPLVSRNPLLDPEYTNRLQDYYTLNASLFAKIELPLGISYQLNFTPRFEWYRYFNHISSQDPQYTPIGGSASRIQTMIYNWQVDNLIKWNKTFDEIHRFDLTFLMNAEKFQNWHSEMSNNRFNPNDDLGYSNIGGGINPIMSSIDEYSTGDALMGRLNYSYKNRYLFTFSLRRDGYSAFGQNKARAYFPAGAFGWVFTDEKFFKSNWFTYGKLRLSYGINGNRDIGRYDAIAKLATGNYLNVTPGGAVNTLTTLELATMSNTNLQWERTASTNVGLDFSILDNVLQGSVELYTMSTTDLLVQRTLPSVTGYDFVMANLGQIDNKGFEINLNSTNIDNTNFKWTTSLNFALNRNKIVHLYGDMEDVTDANGNVVGQKEQDDVTNKWFIGHAIDEIWDLKVLGVWQESERYEAAAYGVSPGDFKIDDVNDDGLFTDEDRQFLGYVEPRFRWNLRNEFTLFKDITVSASLYSYWGHKEQYNVAKGRQGYGGVGYPTWGGYSDRNSAYVLPYWTPDNPINDYARISSAPGGAVYDIWRDKSFIRLDNISMAYTLPKFLVDQVNVENMKVFFNVKNLGFYSPGTFLWDPENFGPTPRIYTLGFNITF